MHAVCKQRVSLHTRFHTRHVRLHSVFGAPASATDSSYETLLFSLMSSVAHVMVYHASDVDRLHISYLEVNTLRARVCACVLECVCVRVCLSACVCECVCV